MYSITSNQYYKSLGKRFDKRAARLFRMGFKRINNEYGSFFVRGLIRSQGWKNQVIPSCLVTAADNRLWNDKLATILRC